VERLLSRRDTEIVISIVTGWEIVMKASLGIGADDFEAAIGEAGATLLPIKIRHLEELSRLSMLPEHRHPFDRMLIAQALAEDLPIVTGDERFPAYKRLRVLWD
jgi:PIN domain nuclease of toxin-antitoxin system